jgi:long-chain acyl-CoA synthetase
MPEPSTLPEMFQATAQRFPAKPALKDKAGPGWRTITWAGYARYVHDLACFLLSLGIQKGDRVAILAHNSPEWAIADFACLHAGAVSVPIYETLAPDKVQHILRDSGARVALGGSRAQAEELLRLVPGTALELVVSIAPVQGSLGKQVLDLEEAYAQGRAWSGQHAAAFEERWRSVQPQDLASLIYTSGTTGEPKGVMLSHGNFASNVVDSLKVLPLEPEFVFLSFLPLSHSFERMAGHFVPVYKGCTVCYAESIERLPENLLAVRPEVMNSVPRLFEKMWARVEATARAEGKERILARAMEVGREHVRITRAERRKAPLPLAAQHRLFDALVFRRIRARVGGKVAYFVTGGAHIREELEWNFTAVGLNILGGYGLTEASPVISVNALDAWRPGSVGKPIPGVEVRIAEDGEILCRGPNVMQGYFGKPEETARCITEDGWLRTGDIGHLDPDGYLYVTDRKKELFKTSGGKYVAPQPIEDQLRGQPLIAEAVCLGNERNHIAALLVPDFEALAAWCKERALPAERAEQLVHPDVQAELQREVDAVNARLSKWETVKNFRVLPQELTQAAGELTPTLKVKRRVVEARYAALIEELYAEPHAA